MRLVTEGEDGTVYTYLLTAAQIIKLLEFSNGTKAVTKENKFYENSTFHQDALYSNYIYIKVNKLKNGTHVGGIWKYSDNVYFPRFQIFREKLLKLERS